MSDTYHLLGSFTTEPATGLPSGGASVATPLDDTVMLAHKECSDINLTVDTAVVVPFGGVTNAHVVFLYAANKIKARITTADGTTQSIPVDPLLKMITLSVPVTAIDLTRVAGSATLVQYFLGEKA
jgi:hypothetical protein